MNCRIATLIEKWPSGAVLASDLGMRSHTHVSSMKCRGRIPRAYWHDMVASAQRRGIKGVSLDLLKELHANIGKRRS